MDQDSFRAFYDKTMPTLRAYVLQRCARVELADDILQEAFLRFLKSAPASLTEAQMRSYLYRTAENLIVDRWHDVQRQQGIADTRDSESISAPAPEVTSAMERAFAQLDPRQQTLVWLAYVEGFDHREIAAAANIGIKSVRVLLHRAKKKLLGILNDMGLSPEKR